MSDALNKSINHTITNLVIESLIHPSPTNPIHGDGGSWSLSQGHSQVITAPNEGKDNEHFKLTSKPVIKLQWRMEGDEDGTETDDLLVGQKYCSRL